MILRANALDIPLQNGSVQCCVTSPPYWGLRDYGTAKWEGGDESCDHRVYLGGNGPASTKQTTSVGTQTYQAKGQCKKCEAVRSDPQLGLESTPEQYVANMVTVFREVQRVLKKDGVLWLNLGDSYAGNRSYQVPDSKHRDVGNSRGMTVSRRRDDAPCPRPDFLVPGLKPKDLVGIPWRVAFALQADGWYLRSDIIWSKPSPMPESVTDRPTKAHEYIFLMSKNARYFYNADAIREPHAYGEGGGRRQAPEPGEPCAFNPLGRNKRSVWAITPQPFAGSHFATFPEEIPRLCILAGSRPGDVVLDPFGGSGTTSKVALELGRKPVHIDLMYHDLARKRMTTTPAMAGLMI